MTYRKNSHRPLAIKRRSAGLGFALALTALSACGGGGSGSSAPLPDSSAAGDTGVNNNPPTGPSCDTPMTDPAPTTIQLAAAEQSPAHWNYIDVDAATIYWSNDVDWSHTEILQMPRTGGKPLVLAVLDSLYNIISSGSDLFVLTESKVQKIAKSDGSVKVLGDIDFRGFDNPLAVDDNSVYTVDSDSSLCDTTGGEVLAFDKETGEKRVLAKGLVCPDDVTTDGRYVYFKVNRRSIQRVPVAGGAAETLAMTPVSSGPVVDDSNVYFGKLTEDDTETLFRFAKDGGTPERVSDDCQLLWGMQVGDDGTYYAFREGYNRLAKDGVTHTVPLSNVNAFDGAFKVAGKTIYQLDAVKNVLWAVERP